MRCAPSASRSGCSVGRGPRLIRRIALPILLVVLVAGLLYSIEPVRVHADSMQPTLRSGDEVLVDRLSLALRAPHRGEIVVANAPSGGLVVKRVAAVGGDTIGIEDGVLVVNGHAERERLRRLRRHRRLLLRAGPRRARATCSCSATTAATPRIRATSAPCTEGDVVGACSCASGLWRRGALERASLVARSPAGVSGGRYSVTACARRSRAGPTTPSARRSRSRGTTASA